MNKVYLNGEEVIPSKVICVGRNYKSHIKEMGGSSTSEEPTIFIKPNSAIAGNEGCVFIPEELGLLHHEVELCFVVGQRCKDVNIANAGSFISAYGVGIDFTLRERQADAKRAGGPWTLAKGFDGSAVFGVFVDAKSISNPSRLDITLKVNEEFRQSANTIEMIFSPLKILTFVSQFMTLEEGDVFMCGTPEGVGEVSHGDRVVAEISGLPTLSLDVIRCK